MFKKVITGIAFAAGLLAADASFAQAPPTVKLCVQNGATCIPVNSSTPLPVNASVSASITGFPGSAQTTGTPIAVTTGGVTGTLPAGAEVVASNVGSTNTAFCKLGASATTSDQPIPPNSWFGFTVGSNTQLTCITATSTTTVNMVGGSGLPTGSGGGGGGGGGGAVFGPTAVGSAAANPPVLMGGTANAGATGTVQVAKVDSGGGLFFNGLQGGSALSATNGWYTNILQGNAVLSATNGIYVNVGLGNVANSAANPLFVSPGTGATFQVQSNSANLATQTTVAAINTAQTNKTQFTQLTDGTNAAASYTSYGTAPTGNVPGANVFVTNTNANGPASAANSSPVTLPSLNHNQTSTTASSLIVKASAGNLNGANCTGIAGAAAGYCVVINATTAPTNGATITPLDACYFDTTPRGCSLAHINGSINFSTGIVVLVTSAASPFTYTSGTDTAFIEADYN